MAGLSPSWGAPQTNYQIAPAMADWGMTPVIPDGMSMSGDLAVARAGGYAPSGAGGVGSGFGLNMGTAQLGLAGIGTLGNLYAAFQAQKLAKQQFKYTKNVTDTNLANQIKTYNTSLTDRANNRQIVEGRTPEETKAYVDANSLSRYGK